MPMIGKCLWMNNGKRVYLWTIYHQYGIRKSGIMMKPYSTLGRLFKAYRTMYL